jgi:hypothetical protein
MRTARVLLSGVAALVVAASMGFAPAFAQQPPAPPVQINSTAIGGVVTSRFGPEAGVWVIAETTDLTSKFAKVVVTDERGRYVIPELPSANYKVWVRGYGLVDSPKVDAKPGVNLNLTAVIAPTAKDAAAYYPPMYWYSMVKIPDKGMFPGTGPNGNGIPTTIRSQEQYIDMTLFNGCGNCHQLGNYATRMIPEDLTHLTVVEAWAERLEHGQAGRNMVGAMANTMTPLGGHLGALADWSARIQKGEYPAATPPRPVGVERNVVVTVRDWGDPKMYVHDLIASDKRNPTVNAYGPLYGATELSTAHIPVLDPVKNIKTSLVLPLLDKNAPSPLLANPVLAPWRYFGNEAIWISQQNSHSDAIDQDGRVWWVSQIRSPQNPPAYCSKGAGNPSADYFPQDQKQPGFTQNSRQVTFYDQKTKQFGMVDICFNAQHLNFAEDANNTLWFGGNSQGERGVIGWLNTKLFLQTGDANKAQGWAPIIVDTNGNGKVDEFVLQGQPNDGTKDTRVPIGFYAISYDPSDGSLWGSRNAFPGQIIKVKPGANPPFTTLAEIYNMPLPGYGLRGTDVDRNGVVWVAGASGQIASFDRRLCKGTLNGPGADQGNQCPEGWAFYPIPGPGFQGAPGAAEAPYYAWVDQHNILGLGSNTPLATGNNSDAILAVVGGKVIDIRIPYPMGFFAKWIDGRIDDANAGWKGRSIWVGAGTRSPWMQEGIDAPAPGAPGKTPASPYVYQVQVRPNPLAL